MSDNHPGDELQSQLSASAVDDGSAVPEHVGRGLQRAAGLVGQQIGHDRQHVEGLAWLPALGLGLHLRHQVGDRAGHQLARVAQAQLVAQVAVVGAVERDKGVIGAALARQVDAGLPVMNQTVLLRGVNDHADTLEALFRGLVKRRVRPYYLLQMDPVRGTGHLRTPLDAGIAIMGALQGRLSGIALPKLIVDTPNGRGKVPVGPDTVVARGEGRTTLRTFRGELVDYLDPPG